MKMIGELSILVNLVDILREQDKRPKITVNTMFNKTIFLYGRISVTTFANIIKLVHFILSLPSIICT